jgi:hypothetical protein
MGKHDLSWNIGRRQCYSPTNFSTNEHGYPVISLSSSMKSDDASRQSNIYPCFASQQANELVSLLIGRPASIEVINKRQRNPT